MPTYRELVRSAEKAFAEKGIPESTALLYMLELSEKERYDYYMCNEQEADAELEKTYLAGVERILNHEPMNYVLGYSWFYGYRFVVDDRVLIPRPETEELVANVLADIDEYFSDKDEIICADVGTGSGAIAITLAKEEPKLRMSASDISFDALEAAKKNAENIGVEINWMQGDMAQPLVDANMKLDVLVCNPPYIKNDEVLEESVKDFEPHVALFGGEDGLYFYRKVFEAAPKIMKPKSFMAFEMGWDQREIMLEEVRKHFGDVRAEVLKDINGKDRMLFVYFNN